MTRPANSRFICVQSSHIPTERLTYNEQSLYIAKQTQSSTFDRIKRAVIETLTHL